MAVINIRFRPFFREPMLSDSKVCTARKKRMGEAGDIFEAFGASFRLIEVVDKYLFEVASLWKQEGCQSREHFVEVWNSIHPRRCYDDYQRVYLHRFQRIEQPIMTH